jgi:hypothetical protein
VRAREDARKRASVASDPEPNLFFDSNTDESNPSLAPFRAVRRALDVSVLVVAFSRRVHATASVPPRPLRVLRVSQRARRAIRSAAARGAREFSLKKKRNKTSRRRDET